MKGKIRRINILGVKISSIQKDELLKEIKNRLNLGVKFSILTPNPELVLASTRNLYLKRALNAVDFAIADGIGLKIADLSLNIIKGRELFLDLTRLANEKRWRVFLLGGLDNEAEICKRKLEDSYGNLKIESERGPKLNDRAEPVSEVDRRIEIDTIVKINKFKPHLLFVAFGNPKQEIWMYQNRLKLDVRGMMGVGGAFRYIAGLAPLPPKWMEKAGLEWLWRLLTEPFRFTRIWNAVVVFPFRVWQAKLFRIRT